MSRILITTGENDLFLVRGGEPTFLKCTGITELILKDQDRGIVTLIGYLPDALVLRDLKCGDIVEIVNFCRGILLRDEYDAEAVIIRLKLLEMRKRIPNPVALGPEQDVRLSIEVTASCRVTFLFESPEEA